MDVFPAFRKRDVAGRGQYSRLDNDVDSQQSNGSRGSSITRRRHPERHVLCDRCWKKQVRSYASKRCLDCKQNMCSTCARQDQITRPWWLPALLAQCWRFFFTKAFIPHSFTELYEDDVAEGKDWVHSQEASHIRPIPRVTRNSLRSYKSTSSTGANKFAYDNASFNAGQTGKTQEQARVDGKPENMVRSRSFEGFKTKRRVRERRSRSVERLHDRPWENGTRRQEKYESNWDNENILPAIDVSGKPKKKIVKGKDVDLELTGDDVKLTVNDDKERLPASMRKGSQNKPSCAVKKTKTKTGSKISAPEHYTEQIFAEVPIWFKRESSQKGNKSSGKSKLESNNTRENIVPSEQRKTKYPNDRRSSNYLNSNFVKHSSDNLGFDDKRWNLASDATRGGNFQRDTRQYARQPQNHRRYEDTGSHGYTVEEPPDQCSICLDDLPKSEARLLQCSHQIHTRCLREYLLRTDLDFGIRCPVCSHVTQVRNYYAPREDWYRELSISTSV